MHFFTLLLNIDNNTNKSDIRINYYMYSIPHTTYDRLYFICFLKFDFDIA